MFSWVNESIYSSFGVDGHHPCYLENTWWRHQMETFPRYWPFVHKGQWRGALMFSLICARINGWVYNGGAGDLRRHRAHYDVIVMTRTYFTAIYAWRRLCPKLDTWPWILSDNGKRLLPEKLICFNDFLVKKYIDNSLINTQRNINVMACQSSYIYIYIHIISNNDTQIY